MTLPRYLTFTGVDDHTNPLDLQRLSKTYPVEWGVMLSACRQGGGRYPTRQTIGKIAATRQIKLAAHLCDVYARQFVQNFGCCGLKEVLSAFGRIELNLPEPVANEDIERLHSWSIAHNTEVILKCSGSFPPDQRVTWLHNPKAESDGAPPQAGTAIAGYAVSISPDHVDAAIALIGGRADHYFLQIEDGVRDELDRFSVERCEKVLRAVWGTPAERVASEPLTALHDGTRSSPAERAAAADRLGADMAKLDALNLPPLSEDEVEEAVQESRRARREAAMGA